jgi:hypothetical protein
VAKLDTNSRCDRNLKFKYNYFCYSPRISTTMLGKERCRQMEDKNGIELHMMSSLIIIISLN